MNVVFVGAGAVFGFHGNQWMRAFKGCEFAVVEPDEVIARLSGLQRKTLDEAVAWADLAIILTPSHIRREVCEPFVEKRTPIVVEKPLTINWDEITWFEAVAQRSWICPVVNIRCVSKIEKMKKDAVTPTSVVSWKERYRSPGYYMGWHGKYSTDGGVLAQQGFHCLDLVCWIGGTPVAVQAIGENRVHKIECEDTATVKVFFKEFCTGEIFCTTAGGDRQAGLEIKGGGLLYETEGSMFAAGTPGHTVLARRVAAALSQGEGPPITVESCTPAVRALHAAYVSMDRDGARVELGIQHERLGRKL
jgi:predicted dehydrogenase